MAIPQEFYDALKNNDVVSVRILMKNSLLFDRSFTEFQKMQKEAERLPNLYEPFNHQELNQDRSQWTKELMDKQLARLMANFCPERIEYVQQIISYLYPATGENSSDQKTQQSGAKRDADSNNSQSQQNYNVPYNEQKKRDQQKGTIKEVVYCTSGGAAAGLIIGAMTGANLAVGLVVGAAAGAIAGLVIKEVGNKR